MISFSNPCCCSSCFWIHRRHRLRLVLRSFLRGFRILLDCNLPLLLGRGDGVNSMVTEQVDARNAMLMTASYRLQAKM